jgi:organic hydroperoxide reductase OsmC/OhrA
VTNEQTPLYTAEATAFRDGHNGSARSSNGRRDALLTIPRQLGGHRGGVGTDPEHFVVAGHAACLTPAPKAVARKTRVGPGQPSAHARVPLIRLVGDLPVAA